MTAAIPQGAVRFESGTNGSLVLDEDAAGKIVQQVLNETSQTQLWRLAPVSGAAGLYHITRFGNDNRALVATGDLTLAVQSLIPTSPAHRWALRQVSGDIYAIENQQGRRVLSVLDASNQPGTGLIIWDNVNAQNQRWRLAPSLVPTRTERTFHIETGFANVSSSTPVWGPDPLRPQEEGIHMNRQSIRFSRRFIESPNIMVALVSADLVPGAEFKLGLVWRNLTETGFDLGFWVMPELKALDTMVGSWLAFGYVS